MQKLNYSLNFVGRTLFLWGLMLSVIGCNVSQLAKKKLAVAPIQRVGHAGTAFEKFIYTNSLEALNSGYQKGFRTFEIDLLALSDNQVVCLHDFSVFDQKVPSTETFLAARKTMPFTPCTLNELHDWIQAHPDTYLMTDIKGQEDLILSQLLQRFSALKDRLIIQIYSMDRYESLREQGIKNMIWTLYRTPHEARTPEAIIEALNGRSIMAITMPIADAQQGLAQKLHESGLTVLAHTINDCRLAEILMGKGVSEIYTDGLAPGACPELAKFSS